MLALIYLLVILFGIVAFRLLSSSSTRCVRFTFSILLCIYFIQTFGIYRCGILFTGHVFFYFCCFLSSSLFLCAQLMHYPQITHLLFFVLFVLVRINGCFCGFSVIVLADVPRSFDGNIFSTTYVRFFYIFFSFFIAFIRFFVLLFWICLAASLSSSDRCVFFHSLSHSQRQRQQPNQFYLSKWQQLKQQNIWFCCVWCMVTPFRSTTTKCLLGFC